MCNKKDLKKGANLPPSLDTLAQLRTGIYNPLDNQEFKNLKSFAENKEILRKRAKRNYIKNALALGLVSVNDSDREKRLKKELNFTEELAAEKKEKDILRSYWNMYHCSSTLVRKNGKVSGRYCKNRLCLVCNSIRAAVSLKSYKPVFDEWGDNAYFVTLTAPTVERSKLKSRLEEMHKIFNQIKEMLYRRGVRKKGEKFEGVRKLECTFRHQTNKFHPHFHFMVKGSKNAKLLYDEWLKRTVHLGTSHKAQDCRKADKHAALEVFKYFTKIVSSSSKDKKVYLRGLDAIFKEFRGRRVIQNFGFKLPKEVATKEVVLPLDDRRVSSIEELQRILSKMEQSGYVLLHELRQILNGNECFSDLEEWLIFEQDKGIPFVEISTVLELLEDIKSDFEKVEEIFVWIQTESDWINEETGEFLTGFEVEEKTKDLTKNFTQYIKKEFD